MIEKLFDMTDFEQSLKEHADDFTIVPSRKVWQGIYKNMHPGRRWPSIPMAFMLLLSLIGIGYLNNAPINPTQNEINLNKSNLSSSSNGRQEKPPGNKLSVASINNDYNPAKNYPLGTVSLNKVENTEVEPIARNQFVAGTRQEKQQSTKNELGLKTINSFDQQSSNVILESEIVEGKENVETGLNTTDVTIISSEESEEKDADAEIQKKKAVSNNVEKILAKKTPKLTFSYFLMPTVTNAYFAGNAEKDSKADGSILTVNPNLSRGNTMIVNAQLGLRLGGQVEYQLNPKLQLLMMGQLSYSGYTIISNNERLATGKLALKDKTGPVYSKAYFTSYGNGRSENQVPLKNYSLQVSIPVGIQYEIWQNKSAGIFVTTAGGPSFVLKSNAHLLSSDGRNYVDDQSLLRKSNYTGYLGTHIEFKAKNLKWRIGPTVTYQLLSTYEDKYPVKEHLVDYGIKIGISK